MIGNYYHMMLSFVLEEKIVLFVMCVHFVNMVQKDLVNKKGSG